MSSRRSRRAGTPQRHDVQPVIQVAAEAAGRHVGAQVAVGRGDDLHVHASRLERAHALHLAKLQDAQQLGLHGERQLAHFVQEQRAVLGELEQPLLRVDGAGERAAHVAEQLALEQRLDDGRAVDRDEATVAARPQLVQGARDELLARAGFSGNQRRLEVRRQPPDQAEQLLHRRSAPDHRTELQLAGDVALDGGHAVPPPVLVTNALEQVLEAAEVERLRQIVPGAQLDGFDGRVDGGMPGHQHDLAGRVGDADRAQHLDSVQPRHSQIYDRQVGATHRQHLEGPRAVTAFEHVESGAPGKPRHQIADNVVVVDEKQHRTAGRHSHFHSCSVCRRIPGGIATVGVSRNTPVR